MEEYKEEEEKGAGAIERVEALVESLMIKRDLAVQYRAGTGVEKMWEEDEALFDAGAMDDKQAKMIDYAKGTAYNRSGETGPVRSEAVVNIVRGRCETAEGRFSDMLLPVDDKNWGLKETPVPEISAALKDQRPAQNKDTKEPVMGPGGKQMTISDVAKGDLDRIKDAMKLMEKEIDDQLTECGYNAEIRKMIMDASRLGTGVIKGPNVVKRIKKVWKNEGGAYRLNVEEEFKPAFECVSVKNIYPDEEVEEDLRKASYIWELDSIKPNELKDLYGVPGYFDEQIVKILQEDPIRIKTRYNSDSRRFKTYRSKGSRGELYEKWTYSGDLDREDLEAMGVDLQHDEIAQRFSAIVVFVNDRPIKTQLNSLDTGDLPYDFFQWSVIKGTPYGIGIPRILSWLQRINNAGWRAMLDNARDSAGANIIIGAGVEPVDGVWEMGGPKLWRTLEEFSEDGDARKAFQQFQIKNNQQQFEAIIELVMKNVDIETLVPTMFQAEQQKLPETLGATNIMMDSNNVGLRGRVKRFDDQITVPGLTRIYHWNMQYNDKNEIKGDYNVNPRGASVLLEKDKHAQVLFQVLQFKGDPDFRMMINWQKHVKKLFAALGLDILNTDEEYEKLKKQAQEAPPPQDPRIEAARMKVEGDFKKAELTNQSDMAEIQAKGRSTSQEISMKSQEAQMERENKMAMLDKQLQIKMMEFAEKRNMSLDQIKAKLADSSMKLRTQIALTQVDGKAPGGIAEPIIEPIGRAEDSKSFTQ